MHFFELPFGLSWIAPDPPAMQRASHALRIDGKVWLVDPVAGPEVRERVKALGEPAGVLQLLDRHERDGKALAAELNVPLYRLPFDGLPLPVEIVPLQRNLLWKELALWWPAERVLICTEAVGSSPQFRAPGDRLAVHPLLRARPPKVLAGYDPEHVLVGHGAPVSGAPGALQEAISSARSRIPAFLKARARAPQG